ncbi:hypothetical protein RF11_08137 [Thelohanellus kitauei]|uniref:Uncharacterized protein n=1 Tax=Thelohanellus kitauei TaxID=669202 RepID=A0A0C2MVK1_THEKT|nr:hypothetical protein RF11_08137 [Thelohanellus kitauei]
MVNSHSSIYQLCLKSWVKYEDPFILTKKNFYFSLLKTDECINLRISQKRTLLSITPLTSYKDNTSINPNQPAAMLRKSKIIEMTRNAWMPLNKPKVREL